MKIILDKEHNFSEKTKEGIIIRRGTVKINTGELSIIPSHLLGKIALVKGKTTIKDSLTSLCHGTGRLILRKKKPKVFNISQITNNIYIPAILDKQDLLFETPNNYRNLEECLPKIIDLIDIQETYKNIAYFGGKLV